ncbi:glycosyltransferase [Tritonibacter mobilis]|jgi:glycosyltransferase involved in cell wall biosynthesis|uniref:glycosyltransferase n=1 Tax=Tritonibacter mobilis TaxID=379347 RepID=UPI000806C0E8|nr:glycosyltransferase [Tritonibacter mobilis]GLP87864.1 glycosyl transferase [Tritonibacter mobilis]SDX47146.1 Glycosyltransferase involved in cell wall bisynthesis [Tritonibacter mobilis]
MSFLVKFGRYAYNTVVRRVLMIGHTFFMYRTYESVFGSHIDAWNPDVIHSHDGVTLPAAANAARRTGAKLVFDSHELEVHRSPPLPYLRRIQVERMERKYLPQADKVITVTERAADYLAHEYCIDRPTVLFNAPPVEPTPMPEKWEVYDRFDVRADLNLHPRDFLFVYTGNITLNRGLELAIIALSRIQDFRDPNERFGSRYHLVAVGKVQSGQDRAIKRLASAYGLEDCVHILQPVAPHRVANYISSANASIIPILPVTLSYEFAMPNKLFEATLSGNPIICSDLLEMGPFVSENSLGLTYSADSPEHCAVKMLELIKNYGQFERSVARQIELNEKYSWEAQERKLIAMYQELNTN